MKFFISLLIFTSLSHAQVKVFNNQDGLVLLLGENCEILESNYQALKKWKSKSEVVEGKDSECSCSEKECRIDVSNVIPFREKRVEGKCSAYSGPNCFNTALITQGILKHRRVVSVDEINFWTESELCSEVPPGEEISPGDLYVLYDKSGLPLHGFTYVSPELVYSKGGPQKEMKYNLEPLSNMFGYYNVEENCHHVKGVNQPSSCSKYGRAYSCLTFDEFEKKHQTKNKELKRVLKGLAEIECETEKNFFPDLLGISPAVDILKTSLQSYRMLIIENRLDPKLSESDRLLWQLAFMKFISLEEQLDLIR